MKGLRARLTLLTVTSIIGVVVLMAATQVMLDMLAFQRLDPAFRSTVRRIQHDPDLSSEERTDRLRSIVADYVASEQGFEEVLHLVEGAVTARWNAVLVSITVTVPFAVLAALLTARYIAAPLLHVSRTAEALRMGHLDSRAEVPERLGTSTEMAGLIRDFNAMADGLQALERERTSMIADVAHELRTPLTILQGQLDAMQYGVVPISTEQLDKASRQAALLGRLVKDLRLLARAEATRLSLDRRAVDLDTILADIIDGFAEQAEANGVTLALETAGGPTLHLDQDRVAQVAINLLDNALRHSPEGGTVTVSVFHDDDGAGFHVLDEGPGLDEEAVDRVFDRFYRTDAARTRQAGGTGIGLAIVKAIVERHGGRVGARNRPEGGSVFEVWFPRGEGNDEGEG